MRGKLLEGEFEVKGERNESFSGIASHLIPFSQRMIQIENGLRVFFNERSNFEGCSWL